MCDFVHKSAIGLCAVCVCACACVCVILCECLRSPTFCVCVPVFLCENSGFTHPRNTHNPVDRVVQSHYHMKYVINVLNNNMYCGCTDLQWKLYSEIMGHSSNGAANFRVFYIRLCVLVCVFLCFRVAVDFLSDTHTYHANTKRHTNTLC